MDHSISESGSIRSRQQARMSAQWQSIRVDRHEKLKNLPKTSRIEAAFDPSVPWVSMLKMAGFAGRFGAFR
jgi:hypothetical protein